MHAFPFFPDFFIVGAPRCGTTALSRYLGSHEKICFSAPKEPHYFSKIAPAFGSSPEDIRRDYLDRCFPDYDPAVHQVVGEGSVSYLYSPEAIDTILEHRPDARFLAMVRDPMEMLPSYHARMLYILEEDQRDFETAWSLQEARARGEQLPQTCIDPNLLRYADIGRHAEHLQRLFSQVGRERCLVHLHDDLKSDPRRVYEDCLKFLGVESDERQEFLPELTSQSYRYAWVQRLVYRPPRDVIRFAGVVEKRAREGSAAGKRKKDSAIKRLRARVKRWNMIQGIPDPLSESMQATLRRAFQDDVDALGELLGRDLGHWLRPPQPR